MQIILKELTLRNKEVNLLENITFTFDEGVYIIEGINGSGKTSLLDILYKIKKNYTGEIYLNNHNIKKLSSKIIKNKITYIRQETFLFESLSGMENINLLLNYEDIRKAEKVCRSVLNYSLDKKVGLLSGGQKKMLDIIIGISKNSDVYLIDEPFNNISDDKLKYIINLIKALRGIVIIVDHTNILKKELPCKIIKIINEEIKYE